MRVSTSLVRATIVLAFFGTGCGPKSIQTTEWNKQLVRGIHEEVWSKGNLAAADAFYDPEFVLHSTRGNATKGIAAVKKNVAEQRAAFADWTETVEQIIAEGEFVAVRYVSSGTHKGFWGTIAPTGKSLKVQEFAMYRVVSGKVTDQWSAGDWDTAATQLGLR